MKKLFLTLLWTVLLLSGCTKTLYIPDPSTEKDPQPVTSSLTTYSNSFKMYDMLYKTDAASGNTFIETGKSDMISGQESYIGYFQCFGSDGAPKWNDWVPISGLPAEQYTNKTVFDISSDGGIIDCFNVKDVRTGAQIPYIQKMTSAGEPAWGAEGKIFYTFVQNLSEEVPPCEGFVAADHNGGAWIAAGNSADSVVVARVDGSGNLLTEMIKFDSSGTLGSKTYVSRPQMMVGQDDGLYLLLQYSDFEGSLYSGYYDLVKISSAGKVESEVNLMPEKEFNRGILGRIAPDGKGGAYVLFNAAENNSLHLFLEHFNIHGESDFPEEIDLNPYGSAANSIEAAVAVEPQSGKCVIVFMDDSTFRTYLFAQIVDTAGNLLLGEDSQPLELFKTEPYDFLSHNCGFRLFHYPSDNRIHLYFAHEKNGRNPLLKTCTISMEGELSEFVDVAELDKPKLSDGYSDSIYAVVDGKLRFWWIHPSSSDYYGFAHAIQ